MLNLNLTTIGQDQNCTAKNINMIALPNKSTFSRDEVKKLIESSYLAGADDVVKAAVTRSLNDKFRDMVFLSIEQAIGIGREKLCQRTRKREVLDAVKIAIYLLYPATGSSTEVGRVLNRDHTTILVAIEKYKAYYITDKTFRQKAQKVQNILTQQQK